VKAAEAGKHVLCEKPAALNATECRTLIDARNRTGVIIGEAFMVRSHPQWLRARELVQLGEIGEVRSIMAVFSYFNRDPKNIRSVAEFGGGALMDIGCYPIQVSRFVLGQEPDRVTSLVEMDPEMQVDRLTSALIQFESTHLLFTCSTQMAPAQWVQIFGTTGRIEVEIPFNAPIDRPTRIFVTRGVDRGGGVAETEEFPICDQYTLQGDAFSQAIRDGGQPPTPLEDSLRNMMVIDAVFESGRTNAWVNL
jgi:predicted dehydrogenase